MIAILLAAAALASAQLTSPPSFMQKADQLVESMDPERREAVLEELARLPVMTGDDVTKAVDLFGRFPEDDVRGAVFSALELMPPDARRLEPIFLNLVQRREPEPLFVGLRGAARLKTFDALPHIRKLVKKKFATRSPDDLSLQSEKTVWWLQYEALHALARIEGEKAFPTLEKKSRQAPLVARLLGSIFWEKTLPLAARWIRGEGHERRRGEYALAAPVPAAALRATRARMLEHVRDPKADRELRHQLALKVGFASTESEVAELLAEHDKTADEETRLMLSAAVFASRSRAAAPLLVRFMKENPSSAMREGARDQLRETLPAEEFKVLLEWAAKNDSDPYVRRRAADELRALPR